MVSTSDGSLLSAVVPRGATDSGFETAVSMIAMATRWSSALSTARARASRRGGHTCARTRAAPGDSRNVCTGFPVRCSWSARAAYGELTGRTAVAPGRRPLAFVERAQAANAADARADDGGDDDHDGEVAPGRDEGQEDFAAAAIGDGAPAPSRMRVGPRGQDCGGTLGGKASVRRRCAAPRQTRRRSRGGVGRERTHSVFWCACRCAGAQADACKIWPHLTAVLVLSDRDSDFI